jgi:hypothetical protein
VRGPENSLDRNEYYLIEKDINYTAEDNTTVGSVNLLKS